VADIDLQEAILASRLEFVCGRFAVQGEILGLVYKNYLQRWSKSPSENQHSFRESMIFGFGD
jgi:hypothetical protein